MDSRELMIHLAIWPNVAWIGGILIAMLWSRFDGRWDAEFMVPAVKPAPPPGDHSDTEQDEAVGSHRIDIRATSLTETSGK